MHPAMLEVFDVETGATLLRFPVDAREMVATGQYSLTAPVLMPANAIEDGDTIEDAPAPKRKR